MDKSYNPRDIEQRLYERWERNGWFAPSGAGKPYCIMIPPPNVTGTLHMGHAFQHTLMDALTRLHRMQGDNTLWQQGTDHAGIATQMVVERQLNAAGTTRHDLGRDAFVARVWEWKAQSGDTISRQERRLGNSVDWSRERFTMDPALSEAVTEVFVRLHEEGLIYRGKRLVNWDPVLHTALSDLEVVPEEAKGHLWHLRYPLADASGPSPEYPSEYLIVATTRPETMLGDTAVAVHPDDERYRQFIGKQIRLPLTGRLIPVIADDGVDPAFGTGCVKITPGHDFNDYEMGKRHNLPLINIFDANAALTGDVPEPYRGLDRFVARKKIVADMEALGLVEKIEPHALKVPRGDRSNAVLEPWLTDQWYVRIAPLAEPAIKAVEDGSIRFVPESWSKNYFSWMHNIQDWCISRQLWWGHRIPAWYDDAGNIYVAHTEAAAQAKAREKLGRDVELKRDEDVLDTWFSSALWPFSTLGWPQQTAELATFYPTSVLVTGFDIIFFWVARMIMMGLKFTGQVPFREVYITGLIRDENGDKMSKSKGNIIDPLDLIDGIDLDALVKKRTTGLMKPQDAPKIEKNTRKQFPEGISPYGTDALRFTFAALATMGRDIRFDLGRIDGYRNFANKLWNAARFVLMNTEGQDCGQSNGRSGEVKYSVADRWIRSRLGETIAATRKYFDDYRFDLASQALYEFAWYEYCDWYLEFSKPVLQSGTDEALKRGTRQTLLAVLESYLRLLHPLMPFVTEEIWQAVAPLTALELQGEATIMLQPYPRSEDFARDENAEKAIAPLKAVILATRQIRGQLDVPRSRQMPVFVETPDAAAWEIVAANGELIRFLANVTEIAPLSSAGQLPPTAMQLIDGYVVHAPLASLIDDPEAELARLAKRKLKIRTDLTRSEGMLGNQNFVANARAEAVDQERARVVEFSKQIAQIEEQERRVSQLKKE